MLVSACVTMWCSHKSAYSFLWTSLSPHPPSHPSRSAQGAKLSFLCFTTVFCWLLTLKHPFLLCIQLPVNLSLTGLTCSQRAFETALLCNQWLLEFSSVQSCPTLCDSMPPCPSPTPRAYSNSRPSSRWCHPTISSSVVPFSFRLQSFPASGSFQMSQFSSITQNWTMKALAIILFSVLMAFFGTVVNQQQSERVSKLKLQLEYYVHHKCCSPAVLASLSAFMLQLIIFTEVF